MVAELAEQGILVRDCANFKGLEGSFIRVAVKDIPSMQRLLDSLALLTARGTAAKD
jgi:threonine-phosphate decarboxylase